MSLSSFGVRKPVVANLFMWAVIGFGIVFGVNLRREFFPEIRADRVLITVPYPGASPDEIEQSLVIKIEDRIEGLRGVDEINSTIFEGVATISVEFDGSVDFESALAEVKREVDALQDLPERAERITVAKFEPNLPAVILTLYGPGDEAAMKRAMREMREDLRSLPGMGDVAISGTRRDEIGVEVRPEAMLEHRVSLPVAAARVREAMQELPGGTVRTPTANVPVRTVAAQERTSEIRGIVVAAGQDGRRVTLGEIASVESGFADVDVITRLNGERAMSMTVFKVGDEDAVTMADLVKAYAAGRSGESIDLRPGERLSQEGARATVPRIMAYELGRLRHDQQALPGRLAITTDLARFITGRLELLTRNALSGAALVFLTLMLMLNWRAAFWVTGGMGISILGTLAAMFFLGVTLNLLTMVGLIIVVGILVDDGIVVSENILTWRREGLSPIKAAIRGAEEIAWPVTGTVTTTIVAFLPLALIEGRIGDMLAALPMVVSIALGVSLIEVLFVLPAHLAHSMEASERRQREGRPSLIDRAEAWFGKRREHVLENIFTPAYLWVLAPALRHRYLTLCVAFGTIVISLGMVGGGRVPFTFLASSDAETINGELRMPIGTPAVRTDEVARRIESAALALDEVKSVFVNVGGVGSLDGNSPPSSGAHLAQIILELHPVELRERTSEQVITALRHTLGEMTGVKSFRLEEIGGGGSGPDINLGLVGSDPDALLATAAEVRKLLIDFEGVFDVADDADTGQREARFVLRPGASELGFTQANLGEQIRAMVYGLEPYTFAGDREDIDVRVTIPVEDRRSLGQIESMHVFTPAGQPVPLGEVVEFESADSFASIRRLNRERIITVTADVDQARSNPEEVVAALMGQRGAASGADALPTIPEILARHPGVRLEVRGRQKDQAESFATLPVAMLAAASMIYVLLAWLFGSYTQPLVILTAVPMAVIGMVWGHFVLGYTMTILSLIGFIALAGIVVNDSLVFIKFYNTRRGEGESPLQAAMATGKARLRAIMLTTLTTVLGMAPLILEQSFQAQFLIPMAITIAGGLISATALTLIVLPSLLLILDDVGRVLVFLWTGRLHAPGGGETGHTHDDDDEPSPAVAT
ncbi:MAG: efflux RND transporter permease subunit [Phycisphaerales bacterium]|nr:efflux RND transporter permease subunit [Phycisphaerales bacterium]MCB9840612.1 efflux RND transporter permease subunit [Phycisphaeraceae bacterium]